METTGNTVKDAYLQALLKEYEEIILIKTRKKTQVITRSMKPEEVNAYFQSASFQNALNQTRKKDKNYQRILSGNLPAPYDTDYEKLVNRECIRLSMSLDAAEKLGQEQNITAPPLVFLHFPPVWGEFRVDPLVDVMLAHGVKECWHGHIHGRYDLPPYFDYRGIRFTNAAADYLDFYPKPIG